MTQEQFGSRAGGKLASLALDDVEQGDRMISLVDSRRDRAVALMFQAG